MWEGVDFTIMHGIKINNMITKETKVYEKS